MWSKSDLQSQLKHFYYNFNNFKVCNYPSLHYSESMYTFIRYITNNLKTCGQDVRIQ